MMPRIMTRDVSTLLSRASLARSLRCKAGLSGICCDWNVVCLGNGPVTKAVLQRAEQLLLPGRSALFVFNDLRSACPRRKRMMQREGVKVTSRTK